TADGAPLAIRTVEESDAAAQLEYLRKVIGTGEFDVTEPGEIDHTEESQRAWVRPIREADNSLLLGAWRESEIVASLNFHGGTRRKMAHSGHFGISVLPGWRGRGIGSALLHVLIDW